MLQGLGLVQFLLFLKLRLFIYLILTQGHFFIVFRGRGRERERNIDVRDKHQLATSFMCPDWGIHMLGLGTKLAV